MGIRLLGIPLKWSALRWALREWKEDLSLNTEAGRAGFRARMLAEGEAWASVDLLHQTLDVPGDVIECGVYRGNSLIRLAMALSAQGSDKTLFGLDSFDGFPTGSVRTIDLGKGRLQSRVNRKFQLAERVPIRLQRIAERFELNIELVPGYFHETLPTLHGRQFSFVHLDCDIYESYKTCLDALYDALSPGGVIVFDEYESHVWPGATRAIDEFFAEKPERPEPHSTKRGSPRFRSRYFVRKAAPAAGSGHCSSDAA